MFRSPKRMFLVVAFALLNVITLICQPLLAQDLGEAERLRVLFVMDTDADNIGDGVRADLDNLVRVLNEVFKGRRHKVVMEQMTAGNVSPDGVLNYYKRLKATHGDDLKDESLLFVYSGHGGLDAVHGQFLATNRGRLYRSHLRQAMDATGARLTVILTNCCSNIAGVDPPNRRVPAEWAAFKQLFFQHRGMVDITAAQEKTFGWINRNGGFFTQCLTKLFCEPINQLDRNGDSFVTWDELSQQLTHDTNQLFLRARDNARPRPNDPDDIKNFESQLPQTYFTGFESWNRAHLHYASRGNAHASHAISYSRSAQAIVNRTQGLNCAAAAQIVSSMQQAQYWFSTAEEFYEYATTCAQNAAAPIPMIDHLKQTAGAYRSSADGCKSAATRVVDLLERELRRQHRLESLSRQVDDLRRTIVRGRR